MADLRHCNHCDQDKPLTDYYRHKSGPQLGQPTSWCKACMRAYNKQHRKANPEQYKAIDARHTLLRRIQKRLDRIDLSVEDYEWLKAAQGGVCPLCERADVMLLIDRAPGTEEVRGLLCTLCAHRLGYVEQADWVERAQAYLAEAPERTRRLLAERRGAGRPPDANA